VYRNFIKPTFDFVVSLFLLFLTLPIMLLAALVLVISNKGKIWFVQQRAGQKEKLFSMIKFRTMSDVLDADGKLLPAEIRLTKIGKFIRRISLDELPQLINVIKGDMSLVGPRPLPAEYLSLYNGAQHKRHEVRPGITGWAQVNGRHSISWKNKFELDLYYVNHISFGLDVLILFKTIVLLLSFKKDKSLTEEKFKGNLIA